MVYQQQLSALIAPENVKNCATESQQQHGTACLLFTPWEGSFENGHQDRANTGRPCVRYCVPVSKLINTEWVNNFVFSLGYKDSVVFGQVTSGNIIKYFSNSASWRHILALDNVYRWDEKEWKKSEEGAGVVLQKKLGTDASSGKHSGIGHLFIRSPSSTKSSWEANVKWNITLLVLISDAHKAKYFIFILFLITHICVFLCVCVVSAGAPRFQEKELDPLKLELHELVSCLTWVLGTTLRFLATEVFDFNHWAISPAPIQICYLNDK